MRINVDVERSLNSGRIKGKSLAKESMSSVGLYILVVTALLGSAFFILYSSLANISRNGSINLFAVVLFAIFFSVVVLVLFGLYQENRLTRAVGKDLQTNKKLMVSVLKKRYNTEQVFEGEKTVMYYRRATFWRFSLRIIVLFEGNEVFVNIARFNQIDLKSVFHEYFSSIQARSILQELRDRLETNTSN